MRVLGLVVIVCGAAACAKGERGPGFSVDSGAADAGRSDASADGGRPDADRPRDARVTSDSGSRDGGVPTDAGPVDATAPIDSGTPEEDAGGGALLDPLLELPDPTGDTCTSPGSLGECAGVATVCRFYDSVEGRCESCGPCGNLNAPCSASSECDILFMCYAGRCTNFCTLGTFECGPIDDCIDIGHPTRGVCRPF